jgi:hypothetical protein
VPGGESPHTRDDHLSSPAIVGKAEDVLKIDAMADRQRLQLFFLFFR